MSERGIEKEREEGENEEEAGAAAAARYCRGCALPLKQV